MNVFLAFGNSSSMSIQMTDERLMFDSIIRNLHDDWVSFVSAKAVQQEKKQSLSQCNRASEPDVFLP